MDQQSTGYTKQHIVILSEAKLQRSGRSPRGQALNLRSFLIPQKEQYPEMFESLALCFAFRCSACAQHDSAIDVRW